MSKKEEKTTSGESEQKPTNSENAASSEKNITVPYKAKEFEIYCLWRALPPFWKGLTEHELSKKFYIDDPDLVELLQISTQEEFSQKYDVNRDTLSAWNKKIKERNVLGDIQLWVAGVLKNVMASTYRSAMSKDPKAHNDRKLMMQFGGWIEKIGMSHNVEGLAEIIKRDLGIN